jgi:prephenate dehydratase
VESENKHYSVICSKDACKKYGLHILYDNFQDSNDNCTLFVCLSKKQNLITKKTSDVITSLLFELKNTSGALYHALGCFAEHGIDMMKIESYIPASSSTSAMFFITIRGNMEDENVKIAISDLDKFTKNIYSFGSYFTDGR